MSNAAIAPTVQRPPNLSGIHRLRVGLDTFFKLAKNPSDPYLGPLFQLCVEQGLHRSLVADFKACPEGRRLLDDRPRITTKTVSIDEMVKMPSGTLGQAYGAYFAEHGITPFDPPMLPVESEDEYIGARLREMHDLGHVVTGYGTDDVGEILLQWFSLGNGTGRTIPYIALFGAIVMGRFRKYGGLLRVLGRVRQAYRNGRATRRVATFAWEDHWSRPVTEVRALLGIPAGGFGP